MAADNEKSDAQGFQEASATFERAPANQIPQKNSDDIVDLRVALAKSATKEFVLGAFFLALLAQFGGFLVIADLKVNPLKDDLAELKTEIKLLSSNTTALLDENKSISTGFTQLSVDIEKAGRVVDEFTSVWLAQPGETKGSVAALNSNFEFYFNNLSDFEQRIVLDRLIEKTEDRR